MALEHPAPTSRHTGLLRPLAGTLFCRLLINTSRRFVYPFAPVIARGLGVPWTAVTSLIAINQATGILGLFLGPLIDRLGYRVMLGWGLGLVAAGMLLGAGWNDYAAMMGALFLAGMGKSLFDPAVQAYVGETVPYRRRGLAIGLLELSWAASTLIGIPLMGWLIDTAGWRMPFWVLGGLALIGMWMLQRLVPSAAPSFGPPSGHGGYRVAWKKLLGQRSAYGAFGVAFFVSAANDALFVTYGAWMEAAFDLKVFSLGMTTVAIGLAELGGETLTATAADRLGLKRSVLLGLGLCLLGYLLLPWLDRSLPLALCGLFIVFLTFEFAIVSFMSLCTELLPGFRATLLSGFFAAAGCGRVFGAVMGGILWMRGGILATTTASAAGTGLAMLCLLWGLRHWQASETGSAGPPRE